MSVQCVRSGTRVSIFEVRHVDINGHESVWFEIRDRSGKVIDTAAELSDLELIFQQLEEQEEYHPRMRP